MLLISLKKVRAATEEQLKIVNNGFNNTVGLTGNTGATDLQKLNQAGGLSFGVLVLTMANTSKQPHLVAT